MLVGLIDPSHAERKKRQPGRYPNWYPVDETLRRLYDADPRWSPWPFELVQAAMNEWQDRDYYSTSMLTGGCYRGTVIERCEDFILDIDTLFASLRGTLIHRTLELSARPNSVPECRFWAEVDGHEISCSPDLITENSLWDWKVCVAPESRVLKADLTWVEAQKLTTGDEVIGFDEDGPARKYRTATVTSAPAIFAPTYRVTTTRGEITVSENHPFLVKMGSRSPEWRRVQDLHNGNRVMYATEPWETDESHDGGYLAGQLDGEGCLHFSDALNADSTSASISWNQVEGPLADSVEAMFTSKGFDMGRYVQQPIPNKYIPGASQTQVVLKPRGGRWETARTLGTLRPQRLLAHPRLKDLWENSRVSGSDYAEVVSVEPLGEGPVIALGTTTKTFVAEGMLQHNTENPPTFDYPWADHKFQVQYNRFIVSNAKAWSFEAKTSAEADNPQLPFDLASWNCEHVVVCYMGPKPPPKPLEILKSVDRLTKNKKTVKRRVPDVWSDDQVLEHMVPAFEAMRLAIDAYPEWPDGLEEYEGWAGPPTWACPGPPLCFLPGCMAKQWTPGRENLLWAQEESEAS